MLFRRPACRWEGGAVGESPVDFGQGFHHQPAVNRLPGVRHKLNGRQPAHPAHERCRSAFGDAGFHKVISSSVGAQKDEFIDLDN